VLHELVEEVADILRPQIQKRKNLLVLQLDRVEPTSLDALRTRQIVTNLLGNAAKFTEDGTINATVSQQNGRLRVAISDDGPGIPAHRLEDIFAPFEQASEEVQGIYGGSGLGLAISRRLAREMGGDLWAESELGEGSTFILEFPVGRERKTSRALAKSRMERSPTPR
ncbi:MAG: ATP-binding protein, partial [Myxococcota bacterium]